MEWNLTLKLDSSSDVRSIGFNWKYMKVFGIADRESAMVLALWRAEYCFTTVEWKLVFLAKKIYNIEMTGIIYQCSSKPRIHILLNLILIVNRLLVFFDPKPLQLRSLNIAESFVVASNFYNFLLFWDKKHRFSKKKYSDVSVIFQL